MAETAWQMETTLYSNFLSASHQLSLVPSQLERSSPLHVCSSPPPISSLDQANNLVADMGKAKQAAQELKILFDRKPAIDSWSTEGASVSSIEGTVEFRDVHFRYPTRPEQPVLRGLNLSVKPGQYIALVGASGCGKSTTIALLERFYDPLVGGIYVDGKEISSLNINEYRSFVALVSQEPTLYQGTIRENVLLGADHDADIADADIEFACREANIYDFIMSLPDGFSTVVGSKGSMLSGGQKQRIAIARALLRDPKILLLDEATSALDSESEHVVQAALDKAAKGRTTIAVAHRLSTIQKADIIYVFDQGVIVESGDHNELMHKGGKYSELVNLQSLGGRKH
jgi:ATP-binding cassette subfamily B (MDR/TAP) protein 1